MQVPTTFRPTYAWWALIVLWWTIDGLVTASGIQAMQTAAGEPVRWESALRIALASAYLWVPLTMLALWAAARWPMERGHIVGPLLVHIAGAIVVSLLRAGAVMALNPWIGWYAVVPPTGELLVTSLRNNVLVYWLLVGVGHAVHYGRTSQAQRQQLAQAQLDVLKAQLHPHFLFNTLNTISAYVRADPAIAERMVEQLSRLLRQSLDSADRQEVSLREELASLEPYLDIEQTRFEDRLRIERNIDPDALDAAVPQLVLQPLVENAIRHGLSRRATPGTVEIAALRSGDNLVLSVRDNGIGLRPGFRPERAAGVGLRNTRARIAQLYGAYGALTVESVVGGGTTVSVHIPYRVSESALHG